MAGKSLLLEAALLPNGWARDVRLEIDEAGTIATVAAGAPADGAERIGGIVVPGMPNLHCHAFQRAMAGLAERLGGGGDDFWAWRETMYRFVERLSPEHLEAIAAQLYVEMLKAGYTAVAEFHYLHNAPDGGSYDDPAELSERVVSAARAAGIRLTLLPVLYLTGDFGGAPTTPEQRRFTMTTDRFGRLLSELATRHRGDGAFRLGIAPHSLRAVPPDGLAAGVASARALDETMPVHIHVAEQLREVEACMAWSGARPVEWLLDNTALDAHWTLIHATHTTREEIDAVARAGAVVGLCPTTEANLGDGLFDLAGLISSDGRFGIGSDSNVTVDPAEELRWLDYGGRLASRRRVSHAGAGGGSVGAMLWSRAVAGGARALGQGVGALAPGHGADLVVLDPTHPAVAGRPGDLALDGLVFVALGGGGSPVRDVMVDGAWRVRDRSHPKEAGIQARYLSVVRELGD
ncbi:MAG: formimidoylglutamate deiminase [Alphaproteobacteria bacterium]